MIFCFQRTDALDLPFSALSTQKYNAHVSVKDCAIFVIFGFFKVRKETVDEYVFVVCRMVTCMCKVRVRVRVRVRVTCMCNKLLSCVKI